MYADGSGTPPKTAYLNEVPDLSWVLLDSLYHWLREEGDSRSDFGQDGLCNPACYKELGTFKAHQKEPGGLWAKCLKMDEMDATGCKILIQDQTQSPGIWLRPSGLQPRTLITQSSLLHTLIFSFYFVHKYNQLATAVMASGRSPVQPPAPSRVTLNAGQVARALARWILKTQVLPE